MMEEVLQHLHWCIVLNKDNVEQLFATFRNLLSLSGFVTPIIKLQYNKVHLSESNKQN